MVPVDDGIFVCGPDHTPTWLGLYLIDVYPTTNAAHARFVRVTGHRAPQHWPAGVCPAFTSPFTRAAPSLFNDAGEVLGHGSGVFTRSSIALTPAVGYA